MEHYFEIQPSDSIKEISKRIVNIFEEAPSKQKKFE